MFYTLQVQDVKAIQNSLASIHVTATTSATTTNTQNAMHKTIDSLPVLEPGSSHLWYYFIYYVYGTAILYNMYNY